MTSKGDNLKTNEFLRLRKLRLQQVREQSKDIAKKIRKRAKVEQLRHVTNIDSNKEKIYLQRQEQLVNRLEQLYSKQLENVGAGHKNASEVNLKDIPEKKDLSKLRGKEAVAELRRKKQEKLDEQKRLLDRKLQAREAANVLSREKSATVANDLMKSSSSKNINEFQDKNTNIIGKGVSETNGDQEQTHRTQPDDLTKNDMGTQWEFEEAPNGWQPNIPILSLPKDDSVKNFNENMEKSDKSKRLDLFALSDEMPSSLRGGITNIPNQVLTKPSLTLVSEYLQNRQLRLREPISVNHQKKNPDELMSIKQTLLKMRASRTDGTVFPNICHVLDEQVIPVPHWRAEKSCEFCSHKNEISYQHCQYNSDKILLDKSPTLRSTLKNISLSFDRSKHCKWAHHSKCHKHRTPGRPNNNDRSSKSMDCNTPLNKKNSVTIYDHNTRDTRDVPHNLDDVVVRDHNVDDDAYSQALKETSTVDNSETSHYKLQQEARNRLAVTKQNVDKEYRDTLAFLNSLPKEKPSRSVRTAFMDNERIQVMNDKHQKRLQQEYRNIEKDCRRHHCKHGKCKSTINDPNRSKSKSPVLNDVNRDTVKRDFQYSWLPVPESDGSLAIHSIPNTSKDKSGGNTVKFSSIDTYHEYRSRHKHTPPTKDINNDHCEEAGIMQDNSNDCTDSSSETDTSSVENLQVKVDNKTKNRAEANASDQDAERIIIYKVIESKKSKKHKVKKSGVINKINEEGNNNFVNVTQQKVQDLPKKNETNTVDMNSVSFAELREGVYKSVSSNGDNIASMYFSENPQNRRCKEHNCKSTNGDKMPQDIDGAAMKNNEDPSLNRAAKSCGNCEYKSTTTYQHSEKHSSAATSTVSFKTALNDKGISAPSDGGYIKFVDDGGQDAGKFYVGASGFLKDAAYEVVIQLRKKDQEKAAVESGIPTEKNIEKNNLDQHTVTDQPMDGQIKSPKISSEDIQQKGAPKEQLIISHASDIDIAKPQQIFPDQLSNYTTQIEFQKNVKQDTSKVELPKESDKVDKASSTSFRDSFAIPDNVPRTDPIPRPATSTYTQTTHSSPIPRPVLMHLSSSTSTTYMSPPDLVLPRYFKKDYSQSNDESCDRHSLNINLESSDGKTYRYRKCHKQHNKLIVGTPPNTTRSTDQATNNTNYYSNHTETGKRDKKGKFHKCRSHSEHKISSKQKSKRSLSENKRVRAESNYSTLSSKKRRITTNPEKANLNPIIENYVKKLLALNKEGLKAIEVVNQECSGVPTPGSSIIEVPNNVNKNKLTVDSKISLEQIKNNLIEQIVKNGEKRKTMSKCNLTSTGSQTEKHTKLYRHIRKRRVHKVKSLNISKQFIKANSEHRRQSTQSTIITTSPLYVSSTVGKRHEKHLSTERFNSDINNFPSRRLIRNNADFSKTSSNSDTNKYCKKNSQRKDNVKSTQTFTKINTETRSYPSKPEMRHDPESYTFRSHKAANTTSQSSESEASEAILNRRNFATPPISISTQTNNVDSEVEFMKLAEDKLQNMEKIADLTDKCTKRLSNLAKVLEEVRKNKSLAYSQISTSDSASSLDQKSDKNLQANDNRGNVFNPTVEIKTLSEALSSLPTTPNRQKESDAVSSTYIPILLDIPKPDSYRTPSPVSLSAGSEKSNMDIVMQQPNFKNRGKPPPALKRLNLRNIADEFVIPHELSTVVEVDSPMSIKLKNHTTRNDSKYDVSNTASTEDNLNKKGNIHGDAEIQNKRIDYTLNRKVNVSRANYKTSTDSSDESKIKMLDLNQFNEVMLKPFVTLQDYAKQYNIEEPDDGSILTRISKDDIVNEELSSLHSEASLPDVMAELLKRNLISEPFKFETTSNGNSTTVSSESTLSMLALSQVHKEKNKSGILHRNNNNAETSESLSISSNPDLEHAFQRLGMGWASSTLKKTKERLALSSSSNTSSSSMPQFKIKSFNNQDIPELSNKSMLSLLNISNKKEIVNSQGENTNETARNALQQTSLTNSMTVKEFLANELAKKITFSNKSNRNTTEDEFVSLCETKMPEEIKHTSHRSEEIDKSTDDALTGNNNRARTSTPVQIFKSTTYRSSSSSNTSNGLFSNADDLSSVKVTSNSHKNHSTSDKDDLTIPNYSLKMRKGPTDYSKSD